MINDKFTKLSSVTKRKVYSKNDDNQTNKKTRNETFMLLFCFGEMLSGLNSRYSQESLELIEAV
ncbi:Dimer Tnp hAT domain-containing protein [Aphis craccivora]|uniref:Dimer Tnp hAT domain-containing protein n=1 Tax=Aphis craccivora TaxID=307492 RepID=A0A6G0YR07_APHCR|nr:Dimer Tnp hAT domain-containing protein [Aphis craccivora]